MHERGPLLTKTRFGECGKTGTHARHKIKLIMQSYLGEEGGHPSVPFAACHVKGNRGLDDMEARGAYTGCPYALAILQSM